MFLTVNTELLTMLMTSLARDADALGSIKVEVEVEVYVYEPQHINDLKTRYLSILLASLILEQYLTR